MQIVELVHAERSAGNVSCTMAIQHHCGISLAGARSITDAVLKNEYPTVSLQTAAAARAFIVDLAAVGVVARFAEGPSYNPQERLALALAQVRGELDPEVLRTCLSLSEHGEWELALSHCLAKLPIGESGESTPAFAKLGEVAVEFGVLRKSGK